MTHNQIDYAKHKENVRHNKRSEKQTDKSIAESIRHNKKTEQLGQANVDLGYANVGLGYSNLGELYRHNATTELQNNRQLQETKRHNKAMEENQDNANVAKVASSPWGYVTYTLDELSSDIVNAVVGTAVKGYDALVHLSRERTKHPGSVKLGSNSAK